jgi:hypothetical protein
MATWFDSSPNEITYTGDPTEADYERVSDDHRYWVRERQRALTPQEG